ncbi:MAG: hypothetical protein Q8K32_21435 [Archangium sp.]|nr:hypothetical protein [Archangium sp.]
MKRLLVLCSCLSLLACRAITLEDFDRPYACDHGGADGGPQCSNGWSCGFDDRCFDRITDGGQLVGTWRCTIDDHCPDGWQCGQEVESQRFCQQRGVGAASPCTDDEGCEAAWRCSANGRCFDPADVTGGTERGCTLDAQCPNAFRCGERVDGRQNCLALGVAAQSPCNTDRGCEAAYRCDTFAHHCVEVSDVIATGNTSSLSALELNPRVHEPAPLAFAMTRLTFVPTGFAGGVRDGQGVMFASALADGGLRVTTQLRDEISSQVLFERVYPLPGAVTALTDLAVTSEGPAVRFADGGASRLSITDGGGWRPLPGPVDFLRQRDPFDQQASMSTGLVSVSGPLISVDGFDAGLVFPFRVREVVAARDAIYGLTETGFYKTGDAGLVPLTVGPGISLINLSAPSRGVTAGYFGDPPGPGPLFGLSAEVRRPNGSFGMMNVVEAGQGWESPPLYSACPDGGSPLQVSFDADEDDQGRPLLISRCATDTGSSFPVQIRARSVTDYRGLIEDQTPFRTGLVTQRSAPFVRAHAGADGRVWHAIDPDQRSRLGRIPLRPVLLDRQPDTMISFDDGPSAGIRVFCQAGGEIFTSDPTGGFVSQMSPGSVRLISIIPDKNWIVASAGLLATESGSPRLIATVPGTTFTAPATGVTAQVQLGTQLRDVVLVASGDTVWFADVTDAQSGPFAQPAVFSRVLVPVPGVALRSLTLVPPRTGLLEGFLTTSSANFRIDTLDLVRWSLTPVATPPELLSLPLEVWAEPDAGQGRTGFGDGRIWSLPIMVPLTSALVARDGGALAASDFGRKCGDLFAATAEGLFRAEAVADGGLPGWVKVNLPVNLDSTESVRLYETRDVADRLFIGTKTGQIVELTSTCR